MAVNGDPITFFDIFGFNLRDRLPQEYVAQTTEPPIGTTTLDTLPPSKDNNGKDNLLLQIGTYLISGILALSTGVLTALGYERYVGKKRS